jgi:hypothetical protein
MGCGSSRTTDHHGRNKKASMEAITDPILKIYYELIQQGVLFMDYTHFNKGDSYKEGDQIPMNGGIVVYKIFKGKENVSKFLSKTDKILKLRQMLKKSDNNNEVGICYLPDPKEDSLVIYLIFNTVNVTYEQDLIQIITSNKLASLERLDLSDNLSFSLLIKLINAIKLNETVKGLNISLIDDFLLHSLIQNFTTQFSIEKLKCSKLGINNEGIRLLEDYFKYNRSLNKLKIDKNNLQALGPIKDVFSSIYPRLRSINFSMNKIVDFVSLGKILESGSNIQKLNLSKVQMNTLENFNETFIDANKFSNLVTLDLSFNYVNLNFLSELLSKARNLRKLVINKIKCDDNPEEIKQFGKAFITSNLETIHFNFNNTQHNVLFFEGFSMAQPDQVVFKAKKLKLFKTTIEDETCQKLFSTISSLDCFAELDFSYVTITNYESMATSLSTVKNLKVLNISNSELSEEKLKHLSTLVESNSSLTTLDIEKNSLSSISKDTFENLCKSLSKNSSLQKLNLNYTFEVNYELFSSFCENLKSESITELWMENCMLPSDSFGEEFSKFLGNNTKLKILKVGSKDEIFKMNSNNLILKALVNLKNLEELTINNIKVHQDSLKEFLLNSTLKKMTLNNVCVSTSYFESLPTMKALQYLDLTVYTLNSNEHAAFIKNLLSNNNKLEHLCLAVPNITPEQVEIIVEGLKSNKAIKEFDVFPKASSLSNSYLKAVQNFYANVKTCTSLKTLPILNVAEVPPKKLELGSDFEKYFA